MESEFLVVDYSKCKDGSLHDKELHYVGLKEMLEWLDKAHEHPEIKIAVHQLTLVIDWS